MAGSSIGYNFELPEIITDDVKPISVTRIDSSGIEVDTRGRAYITLTVTAETDTRANPTYQWQASRGQLDASHSDDSFRQVRLYPWFGGDFSDVEVTVIGLDNIGYVSSLIQSIPLPAFDNSNSVLTDADGLEFSGWQLSYSDELRENRLYTLTLQGDGFSKADGLSLGFGVVEVDLVEADGTVISRVFRGPASDTTLDLIMPSLTSYYGKTLYFTVTGNLSGTTVTTTNNERPRVTVIPEYSVSVYLTSADGQTGDETALINGERVGTNGNGSFFHVIDGASPGDVITIEVAGSAADNFFAGETITLAPDRGKYYIDQTGRNLTTTSLLYPDPTFALKSTEAEFVWSPVGTVSNYTLTVGDRPGSAS